MSRKQSVYLRVVQEVARAGRISLPKDLKGLALRAEIPALQPRSTVADRKPRNRSVLATADLFRELKARLRSRVSGRAQMFLKRTNTSHLIAPFSPVDA